MFSKSRWFVYSLILVGVSVMSCQTNSPEASTPDASADTAAIATDPPATDPPATDAPATDATPSNTVNDSATEVTTETPADPAATDGETAAALSEGATDLNVSGLAQHLTNTGAQMYGAYWCPHCQDQKAMFGDALSEIDYVECDPEGDNAQPQLCTDAEIEGYPTWIIDGQKYPGVQSLERLAELSGYTGDES